MSSRTFKWHNGAASREMVRSDGWVMVRRPFCVPYTIMAKEWDALPSAEEGQASNEAYLKALRSTPTHHIGKD